MLRLSHSPLRINKKSYRIDVCGDIEAELHLSFYCKFHDAAQTVRCNKVCNILTDNKLSEHFDCLINVELLRWAFAEIFPGGNVDILPIIFRFLTMQYKWMSIKRFTLSTPQRKCPMLRQQSHKTRFAGSNSQVFYDNSYNTVG